MYAENKPLIHIGKFGKDRPLLRTHLGHRLIAAYVPIRITAPLECQRIIPYFLRMSSERFEMKVPPDWLQRLDEWREKQPIVPSRAAAIRYLVNLGLRAASEPPELISD